MSKINPLFLNIAGGKILKPLMQMPDKYFMINLDPMYMNGLSPQEAEKEALSWDRKEWYKYPVKKILCSATANDFLEKTILKFDKIFIYRYLEHVPFDQVLYFIYLISTVMKPGAEVDVIVPNYAILAKMLLNETTYSTDFERNNIILTTEMLNEPSCPHASIWTIQRAIHFWTFEVRFNVKDIVNPCQFDGRDIYLRFTAERI